MRQIFLVFTILSFSAPVFLQMPDLNFIPVTNEEKLSSVFATCIEQDETGYIWIGTIDGLNRFDGYDIAVYKHKPEDNSSLVSNQIRCLFNDSKGRLWIGTNFGLCIYNRFYDSFDRVVGINDSSGLETINTSQAGEDKENKIYVASGGNIYIFDEEKRCFSNFLTISHGDISSFVFDNDNHLWIGSFPDGGLFHYNRNKKELTRYEHDVMNPNSIGNNSVMSVALKDDKIWIATSGGGINSLSLETGNIKRYPVSDSYEIYGRKVYVDRNNNLWTCDLTGLKYYNLQSDVFYGYYYNKDDPFTIKKSVVAIFQDRQGNYWTLHSPGGIGLSTISKGFLSFSDSPAEYWHTSNENISAISEDGNGNLWLGNPNNGIDVFYWSKGKTVNYLYNPDNKYSLGKGSINTIYRDRDNKMWIGTYFGGLQYFDEGSGRFVSYMHHPDDTNSLACNDVRSVCEDKEGNLWVVVHGKGVDKFDQKRNIFYHYNHVNNNLSNDWAFQVICDDNNDIWVASAWGLNRLAKPGGTFETYFSEENDTNSLSSSDIICLYEDSENNIWIGTVNGLNLYNRNENRIIRVNASLKNKYICAILEDKRKNIWISTAGGLSMLNTGSLATMNFDRDDGLLANDFNPRSAYINDINGLFFGSIKGVNVFNPDSLKINKERPHVILSNFRLFYEDVLQYSPHSVLKKHISQIDTIILRYKENIITFKFTALNMIHPEKNQYACMMEGFDTRWHEIGTKREATYTNLRPGKYTFRVKASNNDGFWNDAGTSIFIRIKSPWYRRWWFYFIAALSILGLFALFFVIRTAQLRKQKDMLALKVRERTRELSEKNEELKIQAEDLNNTNALLEERQQLIEEQATKLEVANDELKKLNSSKDKFFSIIAHDLRGPFQNILGFSEILSDNYPEIDDIQKKDIVNNINVSAKKVFNLLENLLKWAASQINSISFTPEILNVEDILKDSIHILSDIAIRKRVVISIIKVGVKEVFADSEMVKTIVRNIIGNALKFTLTGGSVEIEVSGKDGFACISVKDNGIGMDKKYLQNLFSIDKMESRPGTENERGSGLGLILCKEFIEKNGGKLTVESKKGTGSKFSFTLPLAPKPD